MPCASRPCRVAQTVHPCTASQARRSIAAPLRASPARAAMLGTANGAVIHESVHPWTASARAFVPLPVCRRSNKRERLLLRQDAAQRGPVRRGEGAQEKPEGDRAGCAVVRCCTWTYSQRTSVAPSRTRRAGARRARLPGCVSLVTFFAQAKKATRSAAGRVEARSLQQNPRGAPFRHDASRRQAAPAVIGAIRRASRAASDNRRAAPPRTPPPAHSRIRSARAAAATSGSTRCGRRTAARTACRGRRRG